MRKLIFLTNEYPGGSGEQFIENEIEYFSQFDEVTIVPLNNIYSDFNKRELPKVCRLIIYKKCGKPTLLKNLLTNIDMYGEIIPFLSNYRRLRRVLDFSFRSFNLVNSINFDNYSDNDEVLVYSYWYKQSAVSAAIIAKKLREKGVRARSISRAHGYDFDESRAEDGFLPFRKFLLKNLDCIYPVCEINREVMLRQYSLSDSIKIKTAYLGVKEQNIISACQTPHVILSCSNLIPLKRVHLIAEALMLNDKEITWFHIGFGEELNRILDYKLPKNINFIHLGKLKNEDVLNFYKENKISIFINVSSIEGLPVSMQEALSFGVPIIGPDNGGIKELYNGRNGILLNSNPTPLEISDAINFILETEKYSEMISASLQMYNDKFNAEKNYKAFIEENIHLLNNQ